MIPYHNHPSKDGTQISHGMMLALFLKLG
ncbi:hypothetical protein SPIRO4BDMA_80130 [uncultured spirochete]|uniref:Uncharacterized protein n=1 Tax=uncultured spirochete TaxID=156406 RepID=A0A3P3XVA5_9SPIR|nr:hypothetical protein SPIRO4BDMA_80130 [uncultured spirochete]